MEDLASGSQKNSQDQDPHPDPTSRTALGRAVADGLRDSFSAFGMGLLKYQDQVGFAGITNPHISVA